MGCGFVCVVTADEADAAVALLGAKHPGAARIGSAPKRPGRSSCPGRLTVRARVRQLSGLEPR